MHTLIAFPFFRKPYNTALFSNCAVLLSKNYSLIAAFYAYNENEIIGGVKAGGLCGLVVTG